jgi:hypothetical protein
VSTAAAVLILFKPENIINSVDFGKAGSMY